jgi:hypothetical protein
MWGYIVLSIIIIAIIFIFAIGAMSGNADKRLGYK